MSLKNLPINLKLIATFCALMSVCLLASAVVFWQTLGSERVTIENNRTKDIIQAVDGATAAMLEQAVNQRGFLLFRSDSTYNDVFAQRDLMLKKLDEARTLAVGRPEILKSIDDMQKSATVFFKELAEPQIAARKTTEAPISEIIEIGRNQAKGQARWLPHLRRQDQGTAERPVHRLRGGTAGSSVEPEICASGWRRGCRSSGRCPHLGAIALHRHADRWHDSGHEPSRRW